MLKYELDACSLILVCFHEGNMICSYIFFTYLSISIVSGDIFTSSWNQGRSHGRCNDIAVWAFLWEWWNTTCS